MKKKTKIGVLIAAILIISAIKSCAELKLSNTSKGKFEYFDNDPIMKDIIKVRVGIMPITPTQSVDDKVKMFWDMRDSIPHTYLKELAKKAPSGDSMIKLLKVPLYVPAKKNNVLETDFRDIRVKFILSSSKYYYNDQRFAHVNTRLDRLNATISLEETPNAYFYTFDRFENQFETIDMGTIDRTNEVKIETKLSGEMGAGMTATTTKGNLNSNSDNSDDGNGNTKTQKLDKNRSNTNSVEAKSGYKAEASYVNNEILKEALKINFQKLKTGYSFERKQFTISQQGIPLQDILDNAYITATIRFKNDVSTIVKEQNVMVFSNLFNDKGKTTSSNNIQVESKRVKYLDPKKIPPLKVSVNYSGSVRAVKNREHNNNYLEFDDQIDIYKFSDQISSEEFDLGEENYGRRVYNVKAEIDGKTHFLQYTRGNIIGKEDVLLFEEYNPKEFVEWIQMIIKNPSANLLKTDRYALYFGPYQLVGEEMNDQNKLKQLKQIKKVFLVELDGQQGKYVVKTQQQQQQ